LIRGSADTPADRRSNIVRMLVIAIAAVCAFFSSSPTQAQIQVRAASGYLERLSGLRFRLLTGPTAQEMGNALMQNGGGLTLLGTERRADDRQVGTYLLGQSPNNYGISRPGVVLTTGYASMCQTGVNTAPSPDGVSRELGRVRATATQIAMLNAITGETNYTRFFNCAELSITFSSPSDAQIAFECTFGTEEYARYVGSEYTDVFGIFLNGSVAANNIAFVDGQPISVDHTGMAGVAETELNGVIVHNGSAAFTVVGNVRQGINTLTFIIADREDAWFDSAVYISGLRMRCLAPVVTQQPTSVDICPPDTATFSVAATNAVGYRWFWIPQGETIPRPFSTQQGWNTPTLTFATSAEHCGARVFCEVIGPCDTMVQSREAIVYCCPCAPPPSTMSLWLPFDDVSPLGVTRNLLGGHNGVLMPAGSGPQPWTGVFVRNSLFFDGTDDYVWVRNHSLVDIADGDLTVDAWILTKVLGAGESVIVDKRSEATFGSTVGYHLFTVSDGTNLRLGFQLADGGFTNWVSSQTLPSAGGWTHVAVTVDRDDTSGGKFYIDGAPAGTFDPTTRQGSLSNLSPFTVGARSTTPSGFFFGGIDEVEVFRRELAPSEIAAIYDAKAVGKCKLFTQAYPPTIYCADGLPATIGAHVFNFTPTTVVFSGSFLPLRCPLFAPPNLPVGIGTVTLGPGNQTFVSTTAVMPAGMGPGDTACYTALFVTATSSGPLSLANLFFLGADGVIVNRPDISCGAGPATIARPLPLGDVANVSLAFDNAGIQSGQFAWRVDALGPDGEPTRTLSLEGEQPGVALFGDAFVPVGQSFDLSVNVSFEEVDTFGMTTLVLSTDTDGDGVYEPAVSASLLCVVPGPCPGDTNGDNLVNFTDLQTVLSEYGAIVDKGVAGDLNNDGVVNFLDLNSVLSAFGSSCD
jgi:hypothetical protein